MYTFLFVDAATTIDLERILRTSARALRKCYPNQYGAPVVTTNYLPNSTIGWLSVSSPDLRHHTFWQAVDSNYAVLVFGPNKSFSFENPAHAVLRSWQNNGEAGIRNIQTDFSAIVVDTTLAETAIWSDHLGVCAPMYCETERALLASPHDLTLLASGEIGADIDRGAICAMLGNGWSPGGRSFIKNVHRVEPYKLIRKCRGVTRKVPLGSMLGATRIDPNDGTSIANKRSSMLASFREAVHNSTSAHKHCQITLSAGLDSRAVFAALVDMHRVNNPEIISSGAASSRDVRVARRLADKYHYPFCNPPFEQISLTQLLSNTVLFSWAMNGDLCEGGHLFQPLPAIEYLGDQPMVLFGDGGEIYTGNERKGIAQAPYDIVFDSAGRNITSEEALELVVRAKEKSFRRLPWKDEECIRLSTQLTEASLRRLSALASDPYDFMDLIYVYERTGVWGKTRSRMTWLHGYMSPYLDNKLCRLAFEMPSPIGKYCSLQGDAINRYLKAGRWMPVNGERLVPGVAPPLMGDYFDLALKSGERVWRRACKIMNRGNRALYGQVRDSHAAMLAGNCRECVLETLGSSGSIGRDLFGMDGVEGMLRRSEIKAVIGLLVVEQWRRSAAEIVSAARE